ncbi:MAG: class I tRNA ligase family protein, partial [Clostridia bacterium]|nr:class I tRNA ligase family protein [Clostridia bacterium]
MVVVASCCLICSFHFLLPFSPSFFFCRSQVLHAREVTTTPPSPPSGDLFCGFCKINASILTKPFFFGAAGHDIIKSQSRKANSRFEERLMKKTVSLLLAILCMMSVFSLCTVASAANTGYKQLNTCSSAYAADGTLRGQTMLEKCITVKRGEKWVVCPQLSTGARQNKSLASEVRFAVWIYDCSTGKRVKTVNLKDGESYALPEESKLEIADKWVLSKLNTLIAEVTENMESYELGVAIQKIYDFVWDVYCDWYIEMTKARLFANDA